MNDFSGRAKPCQACKAEVIHVVTERGREFSVNAEPLLGGKFALRPQSHRQRPLAVVPLPKFAFGRRLYVEHKGCAASARPRRRGGA